jgi:hypothetical protein
MYGPARRVSIEFRYQYMVAMQAQNPKMYRRLRDSGELDRYVNLKAQEASRLYQAILSQGPQPPTLIDEREAEERVKAMMFEFTDDTGTAEQDETNALFREAPPRAKGARPSRTARCQVAATLFEIGVKIEIAARATALSYCRIAAIAASTPI